MFSVKTDIAKFIVGTRISSLFRKLQKTTFRCKKTVFFYARTILVNQERLTCKWGI